jgi:hypothetical protein
MVDAAAKKHSWPFLSIIWAALAHSVYFNFAKIPWGVETGLGPSALVYNINCANSQIDKYLKHTTE